VKDIELDQFSVIAETSQKIVGGFLLSGVRVFVNLPITPVRFLYSGWQSWSLTALVDPTHLQIYWVRY
jgi:hypothetical protein